MHRFVFYLGLLCESLELNHPLCLTSTSCWACSASSLLVIGPLAADSPFPCENRPRLFLLRVSVSPTGMTVSITDSSVTLPAHSSAATMAAFSSSPGLSKDQRRPSTGPPLRFSSPRRERFCREREWEEPFWINPRAGSWGSGLGFDSDSLFSALVWDFGSFDRVVWGSSGSFVACGLVDSGWGCWSMMDGGWWVRGDVSTGFPLRHTEGSRIGVLFSDITEWGTGRVKSISWPYTFLTGETCGEGATVWSGKESNFFKAWRNNYRQSHMCERATACPDVWSVVCSAP